MERTHGRDVNTARAWELRAWRRTQESHTGHVVHNISRSYFAENAPLAGFEMNFRCRWSMVPVLEHVVTVEAG